MIHAVYHPIQCQVLWPPYPTFCISVVQALLPDRISLCHKHLSQVYNDHQNIYYTWVLPFVENFLHGRMFFNGKFFTFTSLPQFCFIFSQLFSLIYTNWQNTTYRKSIFFSSSTFPHHHIFLNSTFVISNNKSIPLYVRLTLSFTNIKT